MMAVHTVRAALGWPEETLYTKTGHVLPYCTLMESVSQVALVSPQKFCKRL